ncbi:MAG: hypothetical protein F4Y37_13145 [Caldilineaceae bacterium SB0664_bin_22]|nr:hypothetical protein [Caldilineaceae bacterium SB0664_bin_22]
MDSVAFLRLHLHGARFADGGVPLKVLPDLAALREMVIDVAKWRYMSANPDRQRIPRGFTDKVDLKLTGIDRGSAMPIISIAGTEPSLDGMPLPYQQYFEQARDDIINTIAAASEAYLDPDTELPPVRFLAYFNRIGRSLEDDEFMELSNANSLPPARLSKDARGKLLQQSTISEVTQEVALRGTVPEVDQDRMTFEMQQVHGGKIIGPLPEQHRETIIATFNGYQDNNRVQVQGIGRYDRQNRLSGLESIEQITPLDPLDVPARLDELRSMQDGWLDDSGKAPSMVGLDWLSRSFEHQFPDDLPLPYTFPMPEGGIEMEWSLEPHSIILEIDLETHKGSWLRFAGQTNGEDERELDLNDNSAWDWLVAEIRNTAGIAS